MSMHTASYYEQVIFSTEICFLSQNQYFQYFSKIYSSFFRMVCKHRASSNAK
jgi:hypothetical protein